MKKHVWWMGVIVIVALAVVIGTEAADPTPSTSSTAPATSTAPAPVVLRPGLTSNEFSAKIDRAVRGNYLLFLPDTHGQGDHKYPLILFLHGSGERGNDPKVIGRFGPPLVALKQKGFPFIVLAPQCPGGKWWSDVDVTEMVTSLLDKICKDYAVDPNRIYLTGMSMGGFGAWDLAQKYPNRWAALAVVCGWGDPYLQTRLKNLPTRVFHGEKDPNVPIALAQLMVTFLRQIGGNVYFKMYPDLGHNVWNVTYDDPRLYEWFLSHYRGEPAQTPIPLPSPPPAPAK
jgi:predicted peptidase